MLDLRTTSIPGVIILSTRWFADDRGAFSETYNERRFRSAGLSAQFVQDNSAFSEKAGTLRGLHFQRPPFAQAKLVRVVRGSVFDVAVDIRPGSPHFGKWVGVELSARNRLQFFIPAGFAHGYVTLEPDTEFIYKVDNYYDPASEGGVLWSDPGIAINWPIPEEKISLAARDAMLPCLVDISPIEGFSFVGKLD